ncbi:YceI family protein [uncultured Psychrobacter sp.]|uniref:YceI family protein n=1 Tax=uncultured Psychrobacter sp. TaxID=259303 RepID=UPI00345A5C76
MSRLSLFKMKCSKTTCRCVKSLGASLLLIGGIASSHGATYLLEPANSNVRFAIDHFNTSTNTGGFYNLTGQLEYDQRAKTGNVSLVIPINTLNTGNKAFDIVLRSDEFFDMEKYPLAYFKSTKWHFADDNTGDVTRVDGELTIRDITHPVTLTATKFNCYFSFIAKGSVCGGDFTTTIDRREWDISKYTRLGITEQVDLNIQIEAAKQ